MIPERRPQRHKSSRTLVITFLIGIGIGFSLCYALLGASGGEAPVEIETITAEADPEAPRERVLPDRQGMWPGRHLIVGLAGTELSNAERVMLKKIMPGGVVLRQRNLENVSQVVQLVEDIKATTGLGAGVDALPMIILSQEYGPEFALFGMQNAPSNASLGQLNDASVAEKLGRLYGEALRNIGISAVFGPVLDIYRHGLTDPARELEIFSSDKTTVAWIGVSFAEGLREAGVLPVVKTYPGMGSAMYLADGSAIIDAPEIRDLVDLIQPFKRAVEIDMPGILVGHAAVPVIDVEQPDLPASLSPKMVQIALRQEFQYRGAVIASDITQDPMVSLMDPGEVVLQALLAGCDAVVLEDAPLERLEAVCERLFLALDEKKLTPSHLEGSKARLDRWRTLLQEEPVQEVDSPNETIAEAALDALGRSAEEASRVEEEHVVQAGETLTGIAAKYGVSMEQIAAWNNLSNLNLQVGQTLLLQLDTPSEAEEVAEETEEETVVAEAEPSEATAEPDEESTVEEGSDSATAEPAPEAPAEEPAPIAAPVPPTGEMVEHKVLEGDTLPILAAAYSVSQDAIKEWNALTGDSIRAGQVLLIYPGAAGPAGADTEAPEPAPAVQNYTVQPGDFLRRIAEKFKTTPEVIMELNDISDPNLIVVGQSLRVPGEA